MTTLMDEYSETLIGKILQASTQEEVKHLCNASVTLLERKQVKTAHINLFAEYSIEALRKFTPMNSDVVQWSNISAARIFLNRIRKLHHSPTQ